MKQKIETSSAPQAIGPYSQAIQAGQAVYFSGQIPLDPKTMTLISDDFAKQTKQVLTNIEAVAKAAGGSLENIVKLTIYLVDLAQFSKLNEIIAEYFHEPYPARTTIQVSGLPKNSQIEIEAIMVN